MSNYFILFYLILLVINMCLHTQYIYNYLSEYKKIYYLFKIYIYIYIGLLIYTHRLSRRCNLGNNLNGWVLM